LAGWDMREEIGNHYRGLWGGGFSPNGVKKPSEGESGVEKKPSSLCRGGDANFEQEKAKKNMSQTTGPINPGIRRVSAKVGHTRQRVRI